MDLDYKINKIKSLKAEVGDFHPLLHSIFDTMTNITSVEYTHGVNEKGADFVLTKFDDIIGDTFYIGVIVKIGKIQIDYTDIERQIEECELPRTILGGKKTIRLSEIWIITNDTVSNNAEEKIFHKFAHKKIFFIEHSRVIKWIDNYLPNYWFDYSINVGKYLEDLHGKVLLQDRQFNLLNSSTEPFYIEQDIYVREFDYKLKKTTKKKHRKVDFFEVVKNEKVSIVEAGMGGGKSKLIRELAKYYSNGENYVRYKFIPVIISYRELVEKYHNDINIFLKDSLDTLLLDELDKGSKILLLIDSVDEWKSTYADQISALNNTLDNIKSISNVHAVITTRHIHNYHKEDSMIGKASLFEIRPLSMNKLLQFLYKICQMTNLSQRIIDDLQKSQLLKNLPKTPIAAIVLANLLDENSKELPANITELYSKYTELMLGRWDIDKGLQSQKEYEAADAISQLLSLYFIDNNLQAISIDEIKSYFSTYLSERNIDISLDNLFDKVINRSGLFVIDSIQNIVLFKHRTFAEFLYAKYHERKKSLIIDQRIYDVYWSSIFFFYIGIKKDCPELLQEIINLTPITDAYQWNRIINLSNFLLAGFLSPYNIVEENLYKIIIEASSLYLKIVKNEIDSPFKNLSEIQILFLFQLIIRDSYSYDFFRDACESINVYIDDSDIDDDLKLFGLFFAGVISMDLNINNPFDFLIAKYEDKLPLQIKLAISHEATKLKHVSSCVKKSIKKLNNTVKDSKATKHYIETLYKTPINIKKIT